MTFAPDVRKGPSSPFFDGLELGDSPKIDEVRACIEGLEGVSRDALCALGHLCVAQNTLELSRVFPGIVDPEVIKEAQAITPDQGCVLRRAIDEVSGTLAGRFPEQRLVYPGVFDDGVYATDRYKLMRLEPEEGVVEVYYSLLTTQEMNEGARLASVTSWQGLLDRIVLVGHLSRAKKSTPTQ